MRDRCAHCNRTEATCQVALRKQGGRWHVSSPLCRLCAENYGQGGGAVVFDAREVLSL